MEKLTTESFKEKVFDYEQIKNNDWKAGGDKPVVIDFYADWCGPCKAISPLLEDLSTEFDGKVDIYKVNIEDDHDLAVAFNVRSIPSLLYLPTDSKSQMKTGMVSKEQLKTTFQDILGL